MKYATTQLTPTNKSSSGGSSSGFFHDISEASRYIPIAGDLINVGYCAYDLYYLYTTADEVHNLRLKQKQAIVNLTLNTGLLVTKTLLIFGVGALASAAAVFAAPIAIGGLVLLMSGANLWSAWKDYHDFSSEKYRQGLINELLEQKKSEYIIRFTDNFIGLAKGALGYQQALASQLDTDYNARQAAEAAWERGEEINDPYGKKIGKLIAEKEIVEDIDNDPQKFQAGLNRELGKRRHEAFKQTVIAAAGVVACALFLAALLVPGVGALVLFGAAAALAVGSLSYVIGRWIYRKVKKAPPIDQIATIREAGEKAKQAALDDLDKTFKEVSRIQASARQIEERVNGRPAGPRPQQEGDDGMPAIRDTGYNPAFLPRCGGARVPVEERSAAPILVR